MRLAASNIAWLPEERREAYTAMAEAEVRGLEIAPKLFFNRSANPFQPTEREAREALDELIEFDINIVSMQSLLFGVNGAELFGDDISHGRFRSGMESAIELAGRFCIPNLVFGSPLQRCIPDNMDISRALDIALETFHYLGDKAAGCGTAIAVEANPIEYGTNFLTNTDQVSDFIADIEHRAVRVNLDLGALLLAGEGARAAELISNLASHINHVHVSEPYLAPAPADKSLLASVFDELSRRNYSGAVSIEMKRPVDGIAALRRSLTRLKAASR